MTAMKTLCILLLIHINIYYNVITLLLLSEECIYLYKYMVGVGSWVWMAKKGSMINACF